MERVNEVVRRFACMLWSGFVYVCKPILRLIASLIGRWQEPDWLRSVVTKLAPSIARVGQKLAQHAAVTLLTLLLLLAALAAPRLQKIDWMGKWWGMQSVQPDRPETLSSGMKVMEPLPMDLANNGSPQPVAFQFSASAAPLSLIGKEAKDVVISPEIKGKWLWVSASRLEFTPAQEWPIDLAYRVNFGAKALAAHIRSEREVVFHSPRFKLKLNEASFYQDPVQLNSRKLVFELSFSHPVNPESLEKNLELIADADAKAVFVKPGDEKKLIVNYDKFRLNATVMSESLKIPAQTTSMSLRIGEGVKAQAGGNATTQEQLKAVSVPGLYSLDIVEMKQLIVTGDDGEPENVLQIGTGMAVNEKEMARSVQAWLLPLSHEGEDGETSVWNDPAEVTEAVLKASTQLPLLALPRERENSENHGFKFAGEPGRTILVRVKKGLRSAGGYQLGVQRDELFRIKRSAPELSIMSKGSLLALSGEKKLPLLVRDLPGVKVEIGRLLPQQLQHLVTQSGGDMTKPEFYYGITPDSLTERYEKKIPLNLKSGKTHYESVNFAEYLKADNTDRRGVFILSVQGFDPADKNSEGEEALDRPRYSEYEGEGEGYEGDGENLDADAEKVDPSTMRDRRLVIVTDMGIITKQALDGSREVFVQSIHDGSAVSGATVEVWGRNGSVLLSHVTDASGRASLPSLAGFVREKQAVVLIVKKAGDLSFLPLNRQDRNLDLSRFDVGGLHSSGLPNQMTAYVFSDRGMYRPGDTMNIGIVAKSSGWTQKLTDLPVEAEVIDARGLVVRRQKMKLGAGGVAEFAHTTQESSPTGNYTINLNLARESVNVTPGQVETPALRLGSVTVKVQEFMPDRMKVAVNLSRQSGANEGWISPQELNAKVNVQNLFGTPAPQRRIEASLSLSPTYPAFASFPDYQFFDPNRAKEKFQNDLTASVSDAQGNAELALGLERYARATYQLHVLVKAFEPEGGRSVAAETTALVSDVSYLVGHKADGDLEFISRNGARSVNFIAIDSKAKRTSASKLKLVRLERRVVSVLVKQPNGLYRYESKPSETVLNETAFEIGSAGKSVLLATQTPGNFVYQIRDAEETVLARVDYSVAGTANVSRSLDRNAELQLSLNKKDYKPGEEIDISIRAPYVGSGLITIERDKVVAHKWFRATNTASVQKITVPKDLEGNAYVTVQFVRDIASNEIFMSPLSYGVVPFVTNLSARTNPIKLTTPSLIKPGQTLKMRLESKQASRAIVFAVDEGILQVARYQAPDPLKFFFQKKALEVSTQQTLDLILPEFKKLMSAAAPGGDGESALGKNLNPFKRKTDKPVVYWSGIVDVNGAKELSYTVPENFNGSLRIMAVAINDDTVGAATSSTAVRGDVILLPNLPVAITPGDEVEIGVGVANNYAGSGKEVPVSVNLTVTGGLEVVGGAQQVLKISERSEGSTKFIVRAKAGDKAVLGSASVIFTAQVKDAKARLSTDVSVRPASAYVTLVQTGIFKGNGDISSQANMYSNLKRSEAAISASPWAFTSGLIQYLDVYPHGCTEQITSQIFPAVLIGTQAHLAKELLRGSGTAQLPDPRKSLDRYLALVRARQGADGGFSMWPGGTSDLFATTYVLNLLLEAKAHQLAVPNDLLQKANVYLQNGLAQSTGSRHIWRTQAYSAYLLTRQGMNMTAALNNMREAQRKEIANARNETDRNELRRDLGAVYLAASYQLLKQESVAKELLEPALDMLKDEADYRRSWYWNYYYDPLVQSASTVAIVAKHFPQRIKDLPQKYWERLSRIVRDGYYQSHSASVTMLAVDAYASAAAQSAAGKVAMSAIDAKGVSKAMELPKQFALASVALPSETAKLKLSNQGDLPLFYSWAESGFERDLPKEAKSQGMEIIHEFLNSKGVVVSEAQLGEELTARVRVRSNDRRNLPAVALVDVLPGGLEPVLNSASDDSAPDQPLWRRRLGGRSSWNIDYADIREDRVIFYGDVVGDWMEVSYKVRATNIGTFVVPAAYGEAMYEHRIYARSAGASFKVKPVNP